MIKVTFTGDIMCKKEVLEQYQTYDGYDFSQVFEPVSGLLHKSDFVVGNLETPIAGKKLGFTSKPFSFNSPDEFAEAVKSAGIGFVSTANNHCLDRGIEGLIETNNALDRIGLAHSGTNNTPPRGRGLIKTINGIKLGILCYTCPTEVASHKLWLESKEKYHVNLAQEQELHSLLVRSLYFSKKRILRGIYRALAIITMQRNKGNADDRRESSRKAKKEIKNNIKLLKEQGAQIIIMNLHAGGQYNLQPESRVIRYANWLRKNGVQFVIINHEHLVQKCRVNKSGNDKGIVAFCLGNFLGGAGVYYPPFDKLVEYSILLHTYINECSLDYYHTFSIVKMISLGEHRYQVVPVYELWKKEESLEKRERLQSEVVNIYNRFLNSNVNNVDIQEEYRI